MNKTSAYPSRIPDMGFTASDESLHPVVDDPYWQESFWVYWGDGKAYGGCIHVGQEINRGTGNVWTSYFADGVAYRRVAEHLPLDPGLSKRGGHAAGGYSFLAADGQTKIIARDEDLKVDLTFTDLFPYPTLLPMFPGSNDPRRKISGTHYQTPGRIVGTMRLGTREIQVDALAQRGHSWGVRNHTTLRGHGSRWITGAYGPDLSFSAYGAIRDDAAIVRTGFVIENGTVEYTNDIEIFVEIGLDGVTYTGGKVVMTLPSGKRHRFPCQFDNVNLFQHHGIELTVTGGRLGEGPDGNGWCAWEIKDRPPTSPGQLPFTLGSLVTDGLYPR